ncbi:hypothetical protein FACS189483_01130 [Spirochaetia bacterium]|nr:hypothetical protein FACS189483_01130 [Spirochaetia bacterium]
MTDIWQETLPVRFGDIDRSDRLTLAAALYYFQEVAISHAEDLGVGRDALARTRQVWVLSRMSVRMERRPMYDETVTVRSWPRGSEKLFAIRDYDIRDAHDTPIVRGRSGWIILDLDKRRPLRVQPIIAEIPLNEGIDALPDGPRGLETRTGLVKAGERRAAYSDIDYNGHVNNTRYIQWIQDITEPEVLEKADTIRFDINYLSEVKYGDITELWTAPIHTAEGDAPADSVAVVGGSDAAYRYAAAIEGRQAEGGQAAFRAELRTR